MENKTYIHPSAKLYGTSSLGENSVVLENAIIGYPQHGILTESIRSGKDIEEYEGAGTVIGKNAFIRAGTTIFSNVITGDNFKTGHNAMIRENTTIGDNVLVGTNVIIDGNVTIGNNVSIQGNVYIPTHVTIEDNVFIGPCAVLANDRYPIRGEYHPEGPILRKGASIGANATLIPGVEIGEGAMVAAGALVTKDVPAWKLAIGCPAKMTDLPEKLHQINQI
ncbi:acyltransferase [Methanolobus profundi]|uniref:Carbonic anhydrase or acetyltransferase, isoleucine patch superfamily n=1 Tax=Methanolobus profundi TaxID=487685 RepID=A0A1I4RWZ2_9EURY|nr:N-acetyltransferase [Methanolobus profundi]SFM56520.1 Carbonic anhydrase or acetyltransferase, isoleucine patch superfamily [Methanolobus profundi]